MENLNKVHTGTESMTKPVNPALCRISNRTSAKVCALLTALAALNVSCGGNVETGNVIMVEAPETDSGATSPDAEPACNPIPNCPAVPVKGYTASTPNDQYYFEVNRWYRVDPATGNPKKVCEPLHQKECGPGENPQDGNCSLATCKGAKTCDPIPARKSKDAPYRHPFRANLPTDNRYSSADPFLAYEDDVNNPIIFDYTPDCAEGESPKSESYLTCDPIPTCKDTIPYCDPLPRCKPGQSPISCEDSPVTARYSYKDGCEKDENNTYSLLSIQGIDTNQMNLTDLCEKKHDSSLNEDYYQMPLIKIDCRIAPECAPGEEPKTAAISYPIVCGKWYTGTGYDNYAQSCDPIKSCKK